MPAVGKITLDTSNYDRGLQKVSQGMSKTGSVISGAASAAGAQVGALGKSFGALGNIVSSVASGPIGMIVAAFGALVYAGTQIWDKMTLSADEYAAKLDRMAQQSERALQKIRAANAKDDGYMTRLRDLASAEKLSYNQKREAAAIIGHLRDRYGELGLAIDAVTGKIKIADASHLKMLERQQQMEKDALNRQYKAVNTQALNAWSWMGASNAQKEGIFGIDKKKAKEAYQSMNLNDKISLLEGMYDKAKDKESMEGITKTLNLLYKLRDMRERLRDMSENSPEIARKRSDATKADNKPVPQPEINKFAQALGKDAAKLLGDAMTANGMGKQAEREALFRRYEEIKGGALTLEEAGKLGQLADLQWKLKEAMDVQPAQRREMETRTNALTSRGGFASAMRATDKTGESIKENTKTTANLLREIRSAMADLGRAE